MPPSSRSVCVVGRLERLQGAGQGVGLVLRETGPHGEAPAKAGERRLSNHRRGPARRRRRYRRSCGRGLGAQQGGVGRPQDAVGVGGVLGERGDAHRDRDRQAGLAGRQVGDLPADALGHLARLVEPGVRQDHGELLAAVAGGEVGFARAAAQDFGDVAQHLVAALVTDRVVDRLEAVEVHHEQAELGVVALGARHLERQRLLEAAVVEQPGEAVGGGLDLHLLVGARVADGDGGEVGEELHDLELALFEGAPRQAVDGQQADDGAHEAQRHEHRGLRLEVGAGHQDAARVVRHVVDELGLVVAHHPAPHALVERLTEAQHLVGPLVLREDRDELVGALVDQGDVDRVVVDEHLEDVGDLHEDGRVVEGRQQRPRDVEQLVAHLELLLEQVGGALELFVLARALDGGGREGGEDLELFGQVERGQAAVGGLGQVEHADHAIGPVAQRHEELVAGLPLPRGRSLAARARVPGNRRVRRRSTRARGGRRRRRSRSGSARA